MDSNSCCAGRWEIGYPLILFVGNFRRGSRLRKILRPCGCKVVIETEPEAVADKWGRRVPHLVVLDGFPESMPTRSVYYQLLSLAGIRFLALNDWPYAVRFIHVNALPFIKMIQRDPKPHKLIDAINDLLEFKLRLPGSHIRSSDLKCEWTGCNWVCCGQIQEEVCC